MTTQAFLYAFRQITPPAGKTLWLYGDPSIVPSPGNSDFYHPHKHKAEAFASRCHKVFSDSDGITENYDAVFIACPPSREETEGLIACALERTQNFVMAVAPNGAGGGRLGAIFEAYGLTPATLSKDKCRIIWTNSPGTADKALREKNRIQLSLRQLEMGQERYWTVPGLFSWNRIDPGSQLLLQHLPKDMQGSIADFGCGYGYLAAHLEKMPQVETIHAFDLDARAVECTKRNAGPKVKTHWQDMRDYTPKAQFDAVVMNPPFHSGKQEDIELGKIFLQKAWQALKPKGKIFLVANRHLPYEKILPGLQKLFEDNQFKILTARVS